MKKFSLYANIFLAAFTYILYAVSAQEYMNCSRSDTTIESVSCPENSKCTEHENNFQCICNEGFNVDPSWKLSVNEMVQLRYCLNKKEITSTTEENKLIIYVRSPAKKEHLAFGILMVLSAALLAIIVIYIVQIVKKLSKRAYLQMKRRRQNHQPLHEYGYEMTGREGSVFLLE